MIVVVEGSSGYTIANNGQVWARLTATEAEELRAKLTDALRPVSTRATTPAKAAERMRPPVMRYAAGTVSTVSR